MLNEFFFGKRTYLFHKLSDTIGYTVLDSLEQNLSCYFLEFQRPEVSSLKLGERLYLQWVSRSDRMYRRNYVLNRLNSSGF